MTEELDVPEPIRVAAEQHGLGRALALFPAAVKIAAQRGMQPLGAPTGTSLIEPPAAVFNPARFGVSE